MPIFALKKMLNSRNLLFLSVVLDIVTRPGATYEVVWARFNQYFPNQPELADEARDKLASIKKIVDDYRRG